jgi:hypothetical protein
MCGNLGFLAADPDAMAHATGAVRAMAEVTAVRGAQSFGMMCELPMNAPTAMDEDDDDAALGAAATPKDVEAAAGDTLSASTTVLTPPLVRAPHLFKKVPMKRTDLALTFERMFTNVAGASIRSAQRAKAGGRLLGLGHTRFATSSLTCTRDAHPHTWSGAREGRVARFDAKKGQWVIRSCVRALHVCHNGDFDALDMHGDTLALAAVRAVPSRPAFPCIVAPHEGSFRARILFARCALKRQDA